jgi:hypothetical protein
LDIGFVYKQTEINEIKDRQSEELDDTSYLILNNIY